MLDMLNRIVNSAAFRRMQDKTQFYYSYKGDHYRTRLTHSIEVMMIAERIAFLLNDKLEDETVHFHIDVGLTQAIALCHDIGHTPFGHIGERTLSSILSGADTLGFLIPNIKRSAFKHNVNSFRVIKESLTEDEREILPWQIYDGACKHTSIMPKVEREKSITDPYGINYLIKNTKLNNFSLSYYNYPVALSIEGQIVAVADEIAQRISDFDDIIRAGALYSICKILFSKLETISEPTINREIFHKIQTTIGSYSYPNAIGEETMPPESVIPLLQTFLISDVVDASKKRIKDAVENENLNKIESKSKTIIEDSILFDSKKDDEEEKERKMLIVFGVSGKKVNSAFEDISSKYVVHSYEIRRCDSISSHIIRQLFKAYYNDPHQLPDNVISHMVNDMNDYCIACKVRSIKEMISSIENTPKSKMERIGALSDLVHDCNSWPDSYDEYRLSASDKGESLLQEDEFQAVRHLGLIFARHIAYYIAGMTDSYALEEYRKLYGVVLP